MKQNVVGTGEVHWAAAITLRKEPTSSAISADSTIRLLAINSLVAGSKERGRTYANFSPTLLATKIHDHWYVYY